MRSDRSYLELLRCTKCGYIHEKTEKKNILTVKVEFVPPTCIVKKNVWKKFIFLSKKGS